MKSVHHTLQPAVPGTLSSLLSLHYGPGDGPKAVIQASLHADEVPGMLVAQHLRQRLEMLEAAGRLRGEVVLVPLANPLGLGQWQLRGWQGRFDALSGENFNRGHADLTAPVAEALAGRLGADATQHVGQVRAALREAAGALPGATPLESLRRTLLGLAIDADIVLDLHCDGEAVLHFYTTPQLWPQAELLARCLGSELVLLAGRSGGDPFDEACSMVWPQLAERLGVALPPACLAATIELRGEGDVSHELAARDAAAIEHFLALRGFIDGPAAPAPALRCEALPLAGSMPLVAPTGGVVVFLRAPGTRVVAGEALADLVDPHSGSVTTLKSPVDGLFFARENRRFAVAGMTLGKVAGRDATRSGRLLSA